mmetsp:Transcript_12284/g.30246  ORF Transcript_12284/g.30246 Transcript_12284/m.30246 type:complete len:1084 (-) Transcript_12284:184-3435(-)
MPDTSFISNVFSIRKISKLGWCCCAQDGLNQDGKFLSWSPHHDPDADDGKNEKVWYFRASSVGQEEKQSAGKDWERLVRNMQKSGEIRFPLQSVTFETAQVLDAFDAALRSRLAKAGFRESFHILLDGQELRVLVDGGRLQEAELAECGFLKDECACNGRNLKLEPLWLKRLGSIAFHLPLEGGTAPLKRKLSTAPSCRKVAARLDSSESPSSSNTVNGGLAYKAQKRRPNVQRPRKLSSKVTESPGNTKLSSGCATNYQNRVAADCLLGRTSPVIRIAKLPTKKHIQYVSNPEQMRHIISRAGPRPKSWRDALEGKMVAIPKPASEKVPLLEKEVGTVVGNPESQIIPDANPLTPGKQSTSDVKTYPPSSPEETPADSNSRVSVNDSRGESKRNGDVVIVPQRIVDDLVAIVQQQALERACLVDLPPRSSSVRSACPLIRWQKVIQVRGTLEAWAASCLPAKGEHGKVQGPLVGEIARSGSGRADWALTAGGLARLPIPDPEFVAIHGEKGERVRLTEPMVQCWDKAGIHPPAGPRNVAYVVLDVRAANEQNSEPLSLFFHEMDHVFLSCGLGRHTPMRPNRVVKLRAPGRESAAQPANKGYWFAATKWLAEKILDTGHQNLMRQPRNEGVWGNVSADILGREIAALVRSSIFESVGEAFSASHPHSSLVVYIVDHDSSCAPDFGAQRIKEFAQFCKYLAVLSSETKSTKKINIVLKRIPSYICSRARLSLQALLRTCFSVYSSTCNCTLSDRMLDKGHSPTDVVKYLRTPVVELSRRDEHRLASTTKPSMQPFTTIHLAYCVVNVLGSHWILGACVDSCARFLRTISIRCEDFDSTGANRKNLQKLWEESIQYLSEACSVVGPFDVTVTSFGPMSPSMTAEWKGILQEKGYNETNLKGSVDVAATDTQSIAVLMSCKSEADFSPQLEIMKFTSGGQAESSQFGPSLTTSRRCIPLKGLHQLIVSDSPPLKLTNFGFSWRNQDAQRMSFVSVVSVLEKTEKSIQNSNKVDEDICRRIGKQWIALSRVQQLINLPNFKSEKSEPCHNAIEQLRGQPIHLAALEHMRSLLLQFRTNEDLEKAQQ